jgi:hypothetical protein
MNNNTDKIIQLLIPQVTLQNFIWEVLQSNLEWDTGCPGRNFLWNSSVQPGKGWGSISTRPIPFPSNSFPFIIHVSPSPQRLYGQDIRKASLNKLLKTDSLGDSCTFTDK